jgi:hypothetical protein
MTFVSSVAGPPTYQLCLGKVSPVELVNNLTRGLHNLDRARRIRVATKRDLVVAHRKM